MRLARIHVAMVSLCACTAFSQSPAPQTVDDFNKQTESLKAQQAYYDQVLATAKSQQAAAEASIATQAASIAAASQLQTAKFGSDLALATAVKGSGLTPAVGKEGTISIASADKDLLVLQQGSLKAIDALGKAVCAELTTKGVTGAAIVPANFEALVQRSMLDVIQLNSLHAAAMSGIADYKNVQMEVFGTELAGALQTAQYLAGGVQALTKLFRTDSNITYTASNRQGQFEQALTSACANGGNPVMSNVEGRLRLSAADILYAWIPDLAKFVQLNDMWSEIASQRKATLTAKRASIQANKTIADSERKAVLKAADDTLKGYVAQEDVLTRYKAVAAAIKSYLAGLGTSSILDSMVWGQEYIHKSGGLPASIENLKLSTIPRMTYNLNVQDATVKTSSTFISDKIRAFSTAEMYYAVVDAKGNTLLAGSHSITTPTEQMDVKHLTFNDYSKPQ